MSSAVVRNYAADGLAEHLLARAADLADGGLLTCEHLFVVDQFHLGGRAAAERVADALTVASGHRVLDLGSGAGGPARLVAARTGAAVTGVDLTPEHVEAATTLSERVGLGSLTHFVLGDAGSLPFEAGSFDAAMMLFVGMHVEDKTAFFTEVRRVLVPGARLVVYDPVRTGGEQPRFPVPWAAEASASFLGTAATYRAELEGSGFEVTGEEDLLALVRQQLAAEAREPVGEEPPDPHFGAQGAVRFGNLREALRGGVVEPRLFVAQAR